MNESQYCHRTNTYMARWETSIFREFIKYFEVIRATIAFGVEMIILERNSEYYRIRYRDVRLICIDKITFHFE